MGSNLANILSLFLVIPFILFTMDVVGIQETYVILENAATQISFQIQKDGYLDEDLIDMAYEKYGAIVESETTTTLQEFGALMDFVIYKYYVGNIINNGQTLVRIKRTVMIGYID